MFPGLQTPGRRYYNASTSSGGGGGGQSFDEGTDPGTQWYVRPNGGTYGSENGTSWNNAYDGFSDIAWASIAAGDTIWVAGGTYTQDILPTKAGTSSNTIKIRRARSDSVQCTSGAGWSAAFDSNITHTGTIEFQHIPDWFVISGAKVQSGGNVPCDDGSCGWKIDLSGDTSGNGVQWTGTTSARGNSIVRWLELEGAGEINISGDMRAFDMTPPAGNTVGNTIGHCWIHDWESGVYAVSASTMIFEYCVMEDIAPLNTATFHPNGIITWGCPSSIVRYSIFRKGPNGLGCGEGVFFEQSGGSTNWQVYGNVFAYLDYTGVKAMEITSNVGAIKVFNNTFVNILVGTLYTSDSPSAPGGEWRNNLGFNAASNTIGTASNNVTATTSSAFQGMVAGSSTTWRISSTVAANFPRDKGTNVGAPYNSDMYGTTRGDDGTYDCGAIEYAAP